MHNIISVFSVFRVTNGLRKLQFRIESVRREESGHCRPQDQALEPRMYNAVKNNFKVGTADNITDRSATVQVRQHQF